jgi:hypothetical protein
LALTQRDVAIYLVTQICVIKSVIRLGSHERV